MKGWEELIGLTGTLKVFLSTLKLSIGGEETCRKEGGRRS